MTDRARQLGIELAKFICDNRRCFGNVYDERSPGNRIIEMADKIEPELLAGAKLKPITPVTCAADVQGCGLDAIARTSAKRFISPNNG